MSVESLNLYRYKQQFLRSAEEDLSPEDWKNEMLHICTLLSPEELQQAKEFSIKQVYIIAGELVTNLEEVRSKPTG